jgi:hypothetical protein
MLHNAHVRARKACAWCGKADRGGGGGKVRWVVVHILRKARVCIPVLGAAATQASHGVKYTGQASQWPL